MFASFWKPLPWLQLGSACLLCGTSIDHLSVCHDCEAELPWLTHQCSVCALPLPTNGLPCGACLKHPPTFERVIAAWRYGFPVDTLISRFKHQSRWPLGRMMADQLARHLRHEFENGLPRPAALLPVPLSTERLRTRGFNQSELIATHLAKALAVPIQRQWLGRTRDTAAQQGLDAAARRRNLRDSFTLSSEAEVQGQHIALVDDVLTTGSTAEMLARLLCRAGAAQVDVYCLARTPKPGD